MTERVHLVRHGESEGNVIEKSLAETNCEERSYLNIDWDADDWPLTEIGIEQSIHSGRFLQGTGVNEHNSEIWSSPMLRARQTACHLGFTAVTQVIPPLYERKTVNISFMDIRRAVREISNDKKARDIVMRGTFDDRVEPFERVLDRIMPSVEAIESVDAPNLVIISHGYIMLGLRVLLEKLDEDEIVAIFRGQTQNSTTKRRQTQNGDVIMYHKNKIGQYCSKQHFGPADGYCGDLIELK